MPTWKREKCFQGQLTALLGELCTSFHLTLSQRHTTFRWHLNVEDSIWMMITERQSPPEWIGWMRNLSWIKNGLTRMCLCNQILRLSVVFFFHTSARSFFPHALRKQNQNKTKTYFFNFHQLKLFIYISLFKAKKLYIHHRTQCKKQEWRKV